MNIAPDQARELLNGATPGPWQTEYDNEVIEADTSTVLYNTDGAVEWGRNIEHDVPLAAAAPDLAQTIAGMTEQWRCEANFDGTWAGITTWESSPDYARATMQRRHRYPVRLVHRLVGPVEVTE